LVEEETDRILGMRIIGASSELPFDGRVINRSGFILPYLRSQAGETITEAVLALKYGASTDDIQLHVLYMHTP